MEPTQQELIAATGISQTYASLILNGKREPAPGLAVKIYRKTGWKHPRIANFSDEQIETVEALHPWEASQ